MLPYTASSYKDVLKDTLASKRAADPSFTFQAMAAHCGIQKTYLSKVLNHDGHLNEDQLYLALEYLGLDEDQREFTQLLMAWEKSIVKSRRERIEKRLKEIRSAKLKTESNLSLEPTKSQAEDLTAYYLDPLHQVIHMYLTLKRFAQEPESIAASLRLGPKALHRYLKSLEKMGIVRLHEKRGTIERAQVLRDNLHLPQDSVLHGPYAARMRMKAMERMDQLEADEAYRFSVIFSTSPKVREKIHASFIDWLKDVQKLVQSGREEEVYQINFDLLNWS